MLEDNSKAAPCIYCNGRNQHAKLTLEHIWPQSLGGSHCPPVFQTRQVCKRCNDLAGQWVDRAYIRNFISSSERLHAALEYLDPEKPTPVPLVYLGVDRTFPCASTEVCERWLGPAGEAIYYIHEIDDDRWMTFAGGDFIKRKSDPGRVYFGLTGHSMYWFWLAIASIIRAFPGARIRSITVIQNMLDNIPIMQMDQQPITKQDIREIDWILERSSSVHPTDMTLNIGFADRFLAKLALGLTHTILGPAATFSSYGEKLRQFLWTRDLDKRSTIDVFGSGPWDDTSVQGIKQFLTWPGAWTLFLTRINDTFGYMLGTPSGRLMSMVMSDDPSVWNSEFLTTHIGGALYFIVPQRERVFGPIAMSAVLAHHLGNRKHAELELLRNLRTGVSALPDRERDNSAKSD